MCGRVGQGDGQARSGIEFAVCRVLLGHRQAERRAILLGRVGSGWQKRREWAFY